MRPRISAVIITLNEENNIRECLENLSWADEIVVVDSGSTDQTVEIAKEFTSRVIHHPWPGYVTQKNYALESATGDWAICLDADERCTPELRDAVLSEIQQAGPIVGFEVRRHVWYLGRWINHGGWYPDWKLRVVRREKARWGGVDPHDRLHVDGETRKIHADIIHLTYSNFAHQIRTINHFSDVVVREWRKENRRFSLLKALVHPPIKFLEGYVWKRGFLDGWPGFVIAVASSFYVFAKYVKLWELQREERQAGKKHHP